MLNNYWDNISKSFNTVSSRAASHNKKYSKIAKAIIKNNCASVLDLGCGSGLLEKELFRLEYDGSVTAIDSSSEMLKIAEDNNKDNLKKIYFMNKEVSDQLEFNDSFDCVVMINLLYLVNNKRNLISKIRKILNKGGLFILVDPKPVGNISEMIKENFKGKNPIQGIIYFFSELKTVYHAIRFLIVQNKLDKKSLSNEIKYLDIEELEEIISSNSFIIEKSGNIQANQNWLIISRRV